MPADGQGGSVPCCNCAWAHLQVMSKQANFVSVRVTPPAAQNSFNGSGEGSPAPPRTVELLCAVRALLKKIKQQVLVGDRVNVVGIDWADKRGEAAAWCS